MKKLGKIFRGAAMVVFFAFAWIHPAKPTNLVAQNDLRGILMKLLSDEQQYLDAKQSLEATIHAVRSGVLVAMPLSDGTPIYLDRESVSKQIALKVLLGEWPPQKAAQVYAEISTRQNATVAALSSELAQTEEQLGKTQGEISSLQQGLNASSESASLSPLKAAVRASSAEPGESVIKLPPPEASNVSGNWSFICCDGSYSGTLILFQKGRKLSGKFTKTSNGSGGRLEGTFSGGIVKFRRTWGGPEYQDYVLTLSDDGRNLLGSFTGDHDPAYRTDFTATR